MIVYAADAAGAAATGNFFNAGSLQPILLLVFFVAVMYFMMIRPQRKKEKETKAMLAALAAGDVITTIGGIIGKIVKVKEDEIFLQTGKTGNINEQSVIRVAKWAVRDVVKKAEEKETNETPVEEPVEEAEEK